MFETENCEITNEKECDILFQITYIRKCDNCEYEDNKEYTFRNVIKCGKTMDQDNWICPKCGKLCMTKINYVKGL